MQEEPFLAFVIFGIFVLSTNHDVGHKSTNRLEPACLVNILSE